MYNDQEKICTNCGSVYRLIAEKVPFRDQDSLNCSICGSSLWKWNESYIWKATLIEKKENHL